MVGVSKTALVVSAFEQSSNMEQKDQAEAEFEFPRSKESLIEQVAENKLVPVSDLYLRIVFRLVS